MNRATGGKRFLSDGSGPAPEDREEAGPELPLGPARGADDLAGHSSDAESAAEALAPPHASAADRLVRFAYRVGVPGATLARPFGRPAKLRLLATVESPLEGNRVAGTALRAGHFLVCGIKAPVAQMNYGASARLTGPLERVVHGFTWLRDLAACGPAPHCAPIAERILTGWLTANAGPASSAAWKVGHVGHRLLNWLVHAPLILSGSDAALRGEALAAMEETARWLDRAVAKEEDRLDEVAGWCALVAAGLLLPDGKPRRLYSEAGLANALGELVGADGGVLSRSPAAQMEALELLVDLAACYRATRCAPPEPLVAMQQLLVPPLLGVTHSDGGLGSWQGAGAVSGEQVAALLTASGVRARPLGEVGAWGYRRIAAQRSVLQFDAAPPPHRRHTRTGCASTLAFELSHGEHRLVVACGGAATAGGQVPQRIEQGLRATAAFSTLVLGDANSTAVLAAGKLGSGVSAVEVDRRREEGGDAGPAAVFEATHDGYVARFGLLHRRTLALRDDGTQLVGEDRLEPAGRKGHRAKVPYALRFHLGPGVDSALEQDGCVARLDLPDGSCWAFAVEGGTIELEESIWVDGDGVPHPTQQLVVQGLGSRGGDSFVWAFEKQGAGVE